jgi:hypothetical protein
MKTTEIIQYNKITFLPAKNTVLCFALIIKLTCDSEFSLQK